MTSMTIDAALGRGREIWFRRGDEDLRGEAVDWLSRPRATNTPAMFRSIAKALKISIQAAIKICKLIDDQKTYDCLESSNEFWNLPISAIDLFSKARDLYHSRLHISAGAADKKIMEGQWYKGVYKPGLIDDFDDFFLAHVTYYMAVGGFAAIKEVRRATGWSLARLKQLLIFAIGKINSLGERIGKKTLKSMSAAVDRGMHFFSLIFAIFAKKCEAKKTEKIRKVKANAAARGIDENEDIEEEDEDIDEEMDDGAGWAASHHPDPGDDAPDHDPTAPPHRMVGKDGFGDPGRIDPQDVEPRAKLKTGRELAFHMLATARKAARGRHRQLMNTIDDRTLVNALRKNGKDQHEIAERMTSFLSFCWQWGEKTGIFLERKYRHLIDAAPESIIRLTAKAVLDGYWETGDNKPRDVPKIWVDVTHTDEYGRTKPAKLTRPRSLNIETKPHVINGLRDGRVIIVNPDQSLSSYFFQGRKKPPTNENIRYFIVCDATTETITCRRRLSLRKSLVDTDTVQLADEFDMPVQVDADVDVMGIDATGLYSQDMLLVAQTLGIDHRLLIAARRGDERALAAITKAGKAMDESQRSALREALGWREAG